MADPSKNLPELPPELLVRPPAFDVCLKGGDVTDRALAGLPECATLSLEDCSVTGGGLHALEGRPLSALRIKRCPLTPGGFRKVAGLPRLKTLYLVECPLPVDWARVLAALPALETLALSGAKVPEGSFRGFEKLAGLQRFVAHGPSEYAEHPDPVDDAALVEISKAPALTVVDLWRSKRLTDAGVRSLGAVRSLRRLSVGDPDHTFSPSDAAVLGLAGLEKLEVIELHTCGRSFTEAGLAALEALPSLGWLLLEACHLKPSVEASLAAGWDGLPRSSPLALARWWRSRRAKPPGPPAQEAAGDLEPSR